MTKIQTGRALVLDNFEVLVEAFKVQGCLLGMGSLHIHFDNLLLQDSEVHLDEAIGLGELQAVRQEVEDDL